MSKKWKEYHLSNKYLISQCGGVFGVRGRILKPGLSRDGYKRVSINIDGATKTKLVHRLVAEAFVDGYSEGMVVNHKNGVKSDNRAENLEWCSQKENINHAHRTGLCNFGESHHSSKMDDIKAITIITFLNAGYSCPFLFKMEYCSRQTANAIGSMRTWRHLDYLKSGKFKKLKIKTKKGLLQ